MATTFANADNIGQFTLNSGTNTISISTDAATTAVNIGTGAGSKGVTLGSTNSTSATVIQAGTGSSSFQPTGAGSLSIGTTNTGALSLGNTTGTTTIQFGTGSALNNYIATTSWTPVLNFGGSTTGITYSTQSGFYAQIGKLVIFTLQLTLTSKGSATGSATITGFPAAPAANTTFVPLYYAAVTYTGTPTSLFQTNSILTLMTQASAQGAPTTLTDTAFANNSIIIVSGAYC